MAVFQFVFENVIVSFRKDFKKSLIYLACPASYVAICAYSIYIGTESFKNELALSDLFYQMLFNISTYRLMLSNMTKVEFRPISLEHLIGLLPLAVHLTCSSKYEAEILEPLATRLGIVLAFMAFYAHFILLSRQYLSASNKSFWIITKNK